MTRRLSFLVFVAAACGGGGGSGASQQAQPLRLHVQALDEAVAGTTLPLLVSVRRGTALERDYQGLVTFETEDRGAWYPSYYRFEKPDGGERIFSAGFVFPVGVHVLTVTGEGIDEPASLAISVRRGSASGPTYVPPPVTPPGPTRYISRVEPPIDVNGSYSMSMADVDGDGDLDILSAVVGATILLLNDDTGAFTKSAQSFPASGGGPFADVDGDGDQDFMLAQVPAGSGSYEAQLWLNAGDGTFTPGQVLVSAATIAFGDVDGDGDPDLILAATILTVRANNGAGVFTDVLTSAGAGPAIHRPVVGDLDGDGDLDLIAARYVWLNDGDGQFQSTGQMFDRDIRGMVLGDMDGDGDLDLVLGNFLQQNDLYFNDGTGAFTRSDRLHTPPYCTVDIALIDVDEDGDLDITEGNISTPSFVWLNQAGTYGLVVDVFTHGATRYCTGDVDGDGREDLLNAEYGGGLVWFRND